jgi:signal transduction histidine kinase
MPLDPLENRNQQLNRLIEISHLSAQLDPEPLMQSIVDMAAALTTSQACSILLYNAEEENLRFVAGPWFQIKALRALVVPVESSIAGRVVTHGRPVIIQEATEDERIYREVDRALGITTQCMASVPIRYHGRTLGVIEAINKLNNSQYTREDITILESLAVHAAIALEMERLHQDKLRVMDEMKELEKMKRDFIAITSHELRTPLGLILGHATFLRETIQEPVLRQQIDAIISSAVRLKGIVESLAKVDQFEAGSARLRRETLNVGQLAVEVTTSFKEMADRRQIQLNIRLGAEELTAEADPEKVAIALNNLLRNALTFTDQGGHVSVNVDRIPGYIQISVVDDGIGIPERDLERVFERFYQVESHMTRHHGGMGLGLSVAKAMVEMHNGQIWVKSQEGKGSTFAFVLPIHKPEAGGGHENAGATPMHSGDTVPVVNLP